MRPRILVIDDLFGRNVPGGRNPDRENLCAQFLWLDATDDDAAKANAQVVLAPFAEAVFCRAQTPVSARVGDTVDNDLQAAIDMVRAGWRPRGTTVTGAYERRPWTLVLLDLCFYTGRVTAESDRFAAGTPEGRPGDDDPRSYFGLTILDAIHRQCPELPVFILSSKAREEVSVEFSRRGALGFIARDDSRAQELLQNAIHVHGLLPDPTGAIVGHSLPLLLALREARRAGRHRENLLVRGERGTGKESLARYVHRAAEMLGGDKSRPFVAVNSAALTGSMYASELFGIEARTATGVDGKAGLIEVAAGGDLFLDEIGDMPVEVQAAVLRVLQERQVTRVGARRAKQVDVRFLSATNADLDGEARGFRADLLDRLRIGGTVWLPALRERREDIPVLVEKFVRQAESLYPGALRREVSPESIALLKELDWPGNVRELRTVLFDAVHRYPGVEHLVPAHFRIGATSRHTAPVPEPTLSAHQSNDPVGAVLDALRQTSFGTDAVGVWAGRFEDLQLEHARMLARYLGAALKATKRRTPDRPEGVIQIHPAVKLICGDATLSASKAADIVKRLLNPIRNELVGDLADAYETAVRLRPKSGGSAGRRD